MRAIFFTKDRPMQFRALVESFTHNCSTQVPISVVMNYREEYDDIIKDFPNMQLYIEQDMRGFSEALFYAIVDARKSLVLFGVDDQILTGKLDIEEATNVLEENGNILTYSFRSGTNIKGFTEVIPTVDPCGKNSLMCKWRQCTWNWGYPFSLDMHVYRGIDLITLLGNYSVPADFEAYVYPYWMANEEKEYFAFPDGNAVAYCQDLNKVQLEHGAPCFGDPVLHSPEYLIKQYREGWRIDWKSAQGYSGDNPFCKDAIWEIYDNS